MYCPKCDIFYADGYTYCDKCGSKLRDNDGGSKRSEGEVVSKKKFNQLAMSMMAFSMVIFIVSLAALFTTVTTVVDGTTYIPISALFWTLLGTISGLLFATTAVRSR